MSVQLKKEVSIAKFQAFVERAENLEKRVELINGEIVEVPSNPFVSVIAARIITFISLYVMQNERAGHISGADGGFIIDGQVFAPDVAYMHELPTNKGFGQQPPLLAVEVISDPQSNTEQTDLRRKLVHYGRANVVVWVVDYVAQQVEVHAPDEHVKLYDATMALTSEAILPGFELPVKDIFPDQKA